MFYVLFTFKQFDTMPSVMTIRYIYVIRMSPDTSNPFTLGEKKKKKFNTLNNECTTTRQTQLGKHINNIEPGIRAVRLH